MANILEHSLDEIKRHPQKSFCPVTQRQKLNRALAEIISLDPSDDMYTYLINRYNQSLDLYHINGRAGSLLPQAASAPAQPTVAKVIAAANAAYEAYAKRIPYGCGGTVEDTAVYHSTFAALVGVN